MQPAASSVQVYKFGLFEADVARNTLTRDGVRVKLQDQPFRVLAILLDRPDEIVTRDELRRKLWPEGTFVNFDGSLNVILKKLRAAIDDDSDNPRFIQTVPRRGYRFIAPVSTNSVKAVAVSPAIIATQSPISSVEIKTSAAIPLAKNRYATFIYASAVVAVLMVPVVTWFLSHRTQSVVKTPGYAPEIASIAPRKSVAVLGFHNISGKESDTWLATAFSEMLSTELAGGEELRLVSGEDVTHLRLVAPWSQIDSLDQETTARIGSVLNSDLLILGSYTKIGRPSRAQLRLDSRARPRRWIHVRCCMVVSNFSRGRLA